MHGIPGPYVVSDGDLVTLDVGVTLDGYIADSAYTFGVGEIDDEAQRLVDIAQDALAAGIADARVDSRIGDISHAVQAVVERAGFSVVRSLVGHGVGRLYHERTEQVVERYRAEGRLVSVDGERDVDQVAAEIEDALRVGAHGR